MKTSNNLVTQALKFEALQSAAKWARRSHSGGGLVVLFPIYLPYGVAIEMIQAGLKLETSQDYGRGRACKFSGDPETIDKVLSLIPKPKSRGSRTSGNTLPW